MAKSYLKDGHILRGVYYKEDDIPVSFISSIRIDNSLKKTDKITFHPNDNTKTILILVKDIIKFLEDLNYDYEFIYM